MGRGIEFTCSKCGHIVTASWGCGFLFPKVYSETVKKIKDNKLGPEIKAFLDEHPDGAINAEETLARCNECGKYDNVQDLTMFVPREVYVKEDSPEGIWSFAAPFVGAEYVTPYDLRTGYIEYQKYSHKCKCCGGKMSIIPLHSYQPDPEGEWIEEMQKKSECTITEIECPVCGGKMIAANLIMWD